MIIGTTGLMSITITMATYRENGILRRLRTTPVSPLVVLVAQVIVVFAMTCLGMLLLIVAGKLVYHVRFEGNAFSVLAGFILSSLSFFGIGFILAGIMPTARTAQVVGDGAAVPDAVPLRGRFSRSNCCPQPSRRFRPSCR